MNPYARYIVGFVLSLALTLAAACIAWLNLAGSLSAFPSWLLVGAVVLLAILQLVTQLVFFLHVGSARRDRWKNAVLVFALLIVMLLVGGTLWIMTNLKHNTEMPSKFEGGVVSPQTQRD